LILWISGVSRVEISLQAAPSCMIASPELPLSCSRQQAALGAAVACVRGCAAVARYVAALPVSAASVARVGGEGWQRYLAGFHAQSPGITEQVLGRARDGAWDPYDWVASVAPSPARVVDLACGSGPLWPRLPGRTYLGVDASAAELAAARGRGAGRLVRAVAAALPLADACVDVVVCSMALQVLAPLPVVLAEITRVLVPGGLLVATMPDRGPLRPGDLVVLAGLLAALGRRLEYPNDSLLGRLPDLLAGARLRLLADERRRFGYPLVGRAAADRLLASLYLPDLPAHRYRTARTVLRGLARPGIVVPVPVRRVIASRR
jgi:SAM-dependent methyltransferase